MSDDTSETRHLLASTAALLGQGTLIDGTARLLTVGALFGLLAHAVADDADPMLVTFALIVAVAAGVAQTWFALRVGLDAALFRQIAATPEELPQIDAALVGTGLMPPAKAGRPIAARVRGAKRLLALQAAALLAQLAAVVVAALYIAFT